MSAREVVTLAPGAAPVRVATGVADVFYVLDDGGQVPLATLETGAVAVAAERTACLRVVPRIGARLAPLDGALDGALTPFAQALAARIGGEQGAALATAGPEDLAAALDAALPGYAQRLAAERAEKSRRTAEFDDCEVDCAYRRAQRDIEQPGHPLPGTAADPLEAVLQILGARQGFTVARPLRLSEPAPDADPAAGLPALAHASGVRYRPVRLGRDWQRARATPYLAFERDGDGPRRPVALLPGRRGYALARPGAPPEPLTEAAAEALDDIAFELYPPLPRDRPITWRDVAALALRGTGAQWRWAALTGLGVALLGLLTPVLTTYVLGTIVPQGERGVLGQAAAALGLAALAAGGFSLVQYFALSRFQQRATQRVQPAFWDRVLSMPPAFFRDYTPGDLSVRVLAVDALQQLVNVQVIGTALAALFALANLIVMFVLSPILGLAGLVVLAVTLAFLLVGVRGLQALYSDSVDAQLRGTSWVVQVLTGIAKVRLAGAERRLEGRYLDLVRRQVVPLARMTGLIGRVEAWLIFAFAGAPALFFLLIGERWAGAGSVDASDYVAFSTAFLAVFSAFSGLTAVLVPISSARPIFALLAPLMRRLPEAATHRADPGPLTGWIELRDVTFRYGPTSPVVLDRLSFAVQPGEMVALVGPSGSGKSTTLRLLLGFDEPDDGQILLDGRDLHDLDLDLVRAQLGVVVQNGQITRATILKNILGGVNADEEAAWRAAEAAALADDIRAMTMQMQTIVEPALLSGGQAQRILLARALVRNPPVVVLDEATSALDNASQEKVTEALDRLGATRIVVAHRLSTIRSADRILVLEAGRVVQEGTYDELMAADGPFARLARRQTA